ncbi:MAG: valine--pyruvate transaminase [Thiothrix sp.]|nr:valine--pyruvate transaminase [Thiothrix sp.]
MRLSAFGERFAADTGISVLMDDLGTALHENPDMIFLGGGNPARIPAMEAVFQDSMQALAADPARLQSLFGSYPAPQGERQFRTQVAKLLRNTFGWPLGPDNIAVSNGSQSAFFLLFNLLGGRTADGRNRSIHLPLAPEYLGYTDIGISDGFFTATRPEIERLDEQLFKYRVDFSRLKPDDSMAALCVSRPTNPTGNVLTDDEVLQLDALAREQGIPLILDGAYGCPFPGIVYTEAHSWWNDNIILILSLSKLGLPGVRTGIIVAGEPVIQAYARANAIASLACGAFGPLLARDWFGSGAILRMSREQVMPFYRAAAEHTLAGFRTALRGLPCHIHKPEGAFFLWLWFEGLPVSSQALYQRLKQRGVLVVPGESFFPGLDPGWRHTRECIRVSYAQDAEQVAAGIRIIADEVRRAYRDGAG